MDTQRAAELQALLEGVALPASRSDLVAYAASQKDGDGFRADLESLPDRSYSALDEVGEELVADGFPPGIAADDGVGVHFRGSELAEVVTVRQGATAYRVEAGAETALEARLLD